MGDQVPLRDAYLGLEARLKRVEEVLGHPEGSTPMMTIFRRMNGLQEQIDGHLQEMKRTVSGLPEFVEGRIVSVAEDLGNTSDAWDLKFDALNVELNVIKKAVSSAGANDGAASSKVRVPDPKPFGGERSAKELENFLWDMETYFEAAKIRDAEKVTITSMYLTGDAKLWWRARLSDDASANRGRIDSWEALKKELQDQFLPCNTSWLARESLRNLKHSGTIRDYVKEFSSLLLDIKEMSDEDKLFNFMAGLQPWAQAELRRQGIKSLSTAIAAADRLVDFRSVGSPDPHEGKKDAGKDKGKPKFKKRETKEVTTTTENASFKVNRGCFLCGGDHRMRECPKRGKLNALVAEASEDDDGTERISTLQLLNAIQAKSRRCKGLMYVKTLVNGKEVKAMVDTGATHNFISEKLVQELGLDLIESSSEVKAVNQSVKLVKGVADVDLQVGPWHGRCAVVAVSLDDFEFILGNEFLTMAEVTVLSALGGLLIGDKDCPGFVEGEYLVEKSEAVGKKTSELRYAKGDKQKNVSRLGTITCSQTYARRKRDASKGPVACVVDAKNKGKQVREERDAAGQLKSEVDAKRGKLSDGSPSQGKDRSSSSSSQPLGCSHESQKVGLCCVERMQTEMINRWQKVQEEQRVNWASLKDEQKSFKDALLSDPRERSCKDGKVMGDGSKNSKEATPSPTRASDSSGGGGL